MNWRTGRHPSDQPGPRQRTIYGPDGELRGVMFTTEDAVLVVDAVNGSLAEGVPTIAELVQAEADARAELAALRAEVRRLPMSLEERPGKGVAVIYVGGDSDLGPYEEEARDFPLIDALLREAAK